VSSGNVKVPSEFKEHDNFNKELRPKVGQNYLVVSLQIL
jgi:hypothetical protein